MEGCLRRLAEKKFGAKNSDCQKSLGLFKYIVSVVLVYMSFKAWQIMRWAGMT
jgi:hypothetical protein